MDEPLGILLLPQALEEFELKRHARDLLSIPRVIALEPSRVRTPRFLRTAVSARQASRLRFPGTPRLLVLYHPAQYPLARALRAKYEQPELWYVPPAESSVVEASDELIEFDDLARSHATQTLVVREVAVEDAPLRERLRELEVISHRPFAPSARLGPRRRR